MAVSKRYLTLLAAAGLALLVIGPVLSDEADAPVPGSAAAPSSDTSPTARTPDRLDVLLPATGGDGDSWRDTEGREYRLGLVNTPETDECFGAEATQERKTLTAAGFSADVYAEDRYGRSVAVVRTADGRDLNVHLARYGFADDRYLEPFRDEHPQLAARLDTAFAAARAERRGLWGACSNGAQTPVPAGPVALEETAVATASGGGCHADYLTCIAVQGDGSGAGTSNDLDCGSIDGAVHLRQPGVDPYRLDGDGDGIGCNA